MVGILGIVPLVTTGVSLLVGIAHKIERVVNSSEHNFKTDLKKLLEPIIGSQVTEKIHGFLNTGKDQGLGDRLRVLMSTGLIPSSLASSIAQLASRNGVPQTSIDRNVLHRPMEQHEALQTLDEAQAKKLGIGQMYSKTLADYQASQQLHKKYLMENMPRN